MNNIPSVLAKLRQTVPSDDMSANQHHGRIHLGSLLLRDGTCKYRMVSILRWEGYLNLQADRPREISK